MESLTDDWTSTASAAPRWAQLQIGKCEPSCQWFSGKEQEQSSERCSQSPYTKEGRTHQVLIMKNFAYPCSVS